MEFFVHIENNQTISDIKKKEKKKSIRKGLMKDSHSIDWIVFETQYSHLLINARVTFLEMSHYLNIICP